jgi:uridine kinase
MHNKPYIIGITGGSGSGKTSIIELLRKTFKPTELCLISQDNYYKDRKAHSIDENGVTNFDLPSCLNEEHFLNDIKTLIEGKSIQIEEYTFNNSKAQSRKIELFSAPIIIVEGLFVFHFEGMKKLMDLKVFVDACEETRLKRRIHRDQVERNYPLDDVLYRFKHHVTPAYNKYILPYQKLSDIIINNEFSYEEAVKVISGYIKCKL